MAFIFKNSYGVSVAKIYLYPGSKNTKGRLILKGLFGFFTSPKKRVKSFCPTRLGQKLKFSSSLFGRIEDTKISFLD
jgi:hypothetical protein